MQERLNSVWGYKHTTGLKSASKLFFALSSSFFESALRKNVVWRAFWFVDASSLTLYWDITCFAISPRVVGLPSLPAEDRSMDERENVSETTGCFEAAGLMRGPAPAPHAEAAGLLAAWGAGARDGNASWDSVSMVPLVAGARGLTGVSSTKLGNGSGAPSSSCLFYSARCEPRRRRAIWQGPYLEVSSGESHGGIS